MVSQPLKTITSQGDSPEPPPAKKRLAQFLKNTEMCKHYQRGYCRFADKCSYAHETDELITRPDFAKTRVCAYFLAGRCVNDNCPFAHDEEEKHQSRVKHTKSLSKQQPGRQAFSSQPPKGSIYQSAWDNSLTESVKCDKASFFDNELLSGRRSSLPLSFESKLSLPPPRRFAWEALKVPRDVHELLLSMSDVIAQEPKGLFPRNGVADLDLPSEQNGQKLQAVLQAAVKPIAQPKLKEMGRDETHGRPQQVKQTWPHSQELHEWLRACEHAEQLSDMMENEIAELFMSDTELAAIFPRLTQQCMWRVSVLSL